MRRGARALLLGSTILLAAVLQASPAQPSSPVTTTDVSPAQEALVTWAIGLFESADLPLPPLDVVRHADVDGCAGRRGSHTWQDGRSTIHLCTPDAGPVEAHLVLHELAHAWDRVGLGDQERAAFLALRGLQQWRGGDDWHRLGAEQAAEILVWGLMDRPVWPVYLEHRTCPELHAGYVVLTGKPPLHGYTDFC